MANTHEGVTIWKSEIERRIRQAITASNGALGPCYAEISGDLVDPILGPTGEFVYRIPLSHWPQASVVVYSSVDKETERTRPYGTDAVRLVHQWTREDGMTAHTKGLTKYRTEGLKYGDNLVEALLEMSREHVVRSQNPAKPWNETYNAEFALASLNLDCRDVESELDPVPFIRPELTPSRAAMKP